MAKNNYDFDAAKGPAWLDKEVYRFIKEEVSQWPAWKQSAFGVDSATFSKGQSISANH